MNFMSKQINVATAQTIKKCVFILLKPVLSILCGRNWCSILSPSDHLIFDGFHAPSKYLEAGNDHFALFGL